LKWTWTIWINTQISGPVVPLVGEVVHEESKESVHVPTSEEITWDVEVEHERKSEKQNIVMKSGFLTIPTPKNIARPLQPGFILTHSASSKSLQHPQNADRHLPCGQ
jgi:hypothetical protein